MSAEPSPELVGIVGRLARMGPRAEALRRATAQFGDDFDLAAWTRAFDSDDPDDINRVAQVHDGFSALVNHLVEMHKSAMKVVGLPEPKTRKVKHYLRVVRDDGGLSEAQLDVLDDCNWLRGRLQHASPDVQADEVHAQVRVLLARLPGMLDRFVRWMRGHGVELTL